MKPLEALREAGHDVDLLGVKAGEKVKGKKGTEVTVDAAVTDKDAKSYDALVIPGGYSPDHLRMDKDVVRFVGSAVAKAVDGNSLLALFGVVMLVVGGLMLRKRRGEGDPDVRLTKASAPVLLPWLLGIGLAVGLFSGFFGIGGGFLIVPGLMLATSMPLPMAIGTSLVAVSAFGAATAASYAASGLIDWPLAGLFILGGVLGGLVGSRLGQRLAGRKRALTVTFAGLVILVGLYVVARGALPLLGANT